MMTIRKEATDAAASLIFQRIGDSSHNPYLFNIRSIRVAVVDGELSLVCIHNLVDLTLAVLGKLLGGLLSILYRLLHHLGLHLAESHKLIFHRIVVTTIHYGYALLEQFPLTGNKTADKLHIIRRNSDDGSYIVTIRILVFSISLDRKSVV